MKKFVMSAALLALSFSAQAKGVDATLSQIEFENNAICEYTGSGNWQVNLGVWTWDEKFYICESNERIFKIGLKVRKSYDSDWTVTKVINY